MKEKPSWMGLVFYKRGSRDIFSLHCWYTVSRHNERGKEISKQRWPCWHISIGLFNFQNCEQYISVFYKLSHPWCVLQQPSRLRKATIRKYHKMVGSNHKNILSYRFESWKVSRYWQEGSVTGLWERNLFQGSLLGLQATIFTLCFFIYCLSSIYVCVHIFPFTRTPDIELGPT